MSTTTRLEVQPLSGAVGAEIHGVDLGGDVDDATIADIRRALLDHCVIFFRDQEFDAEQHKALARRFGKIFIHPNYYGLQLDPEILEIRREPGDTKVVGEDWHTDTTMMAEPPMGAILYALEVPPTGGDTYWANQCAAHAALPGELAGRIQGRRAVHDATYNSAGIKRKGYDDVTDPRKAPGARHALVREHPETGRETLFLGRRRNSYIEGLDLAQSEALLDALWAHATQARFVFRHQWRAGDVVVWDNRCTLHRRDPFDPAARRLMHRSQIRAASR
jgi:taurine dioxygenase